MPKEKQAPDAQAENQEDKAENQEDKAENQKDTARSTDKGKPSAEQAPEQAGAKHANGREAPITRIGSYQVVKQVGEGVTEIVFQAEQQEPVQFKVAVTIIKEGLDWQQIVDRFEVERLRLSLLDHPHIAKLLGVGTRPSGQPYFVMEWVEGAPITKYCDEHQMALQQRLELFVTVCQAVQYAHQKGVIHGDLKPSNVLVDGEGDKPAPKILDFGVTEVVRRRSSESSPPAEPDGKPEYMSPDQADAKNRDVDARNDVYSLGVLLYELLTGTTPLREERRQGQSRTEALRLIREQEVPPPSKRLNDLGDDLQAVAEKRRMKPDALVKAVRGELDCLVMKALKKDRAHRYETAHDLAREVQRHLAHEPLEACPPSSWRRMWHLARQHPRVLTTVAVVACLLLLLTIGGVGMGAWEWHEKDKAEKKEEEANKKEKKAKKEEEETKAKLHLAETARKAAVKEREKAEKEAKAARRSEEDTKAVLAFLNDKLLSAGRPAGVSIAESFWAQGRNKDVTLRKAVDMAEARVAPAFADRPMGEASIREMLGRAYLNLGEAGLAVKQYERAFALRKAMQGVNDPDTAECRNRLAVAYRLADRPAPAGRLFDHNPKSSAHASALAERGTMLLSQKNPAEAELKLRECLAIRQKIQPHDWTTFETKSLLGEALLDQKKYDDAEPLLRSGYEGMKQREAQIPSQDKASLTKALERLIRLYEAWGKNDEAVKWRKELETVNTPKTS